MKTPICSKCGCNGVILSHNEKRGRESRWKCWNWQCRFIWNTKNRRKENK